MSKIKRVKKGKKVTTAIALELIETLSQLGYGFLSTDGKKLMSQDVSRCLKNVSNFETFKNTENKEIQDLCLKDVSSLSQAEILIQSDLQAKMSQMSQDTLDPFLEKDSSSIQVPLNDISNDVSNDVSNFETDETRKKVDFQTSENNIGFPETLRQNDLKDIQDKDLSHETNLRQNETDETLPSQSYEKSMSQPETSLRQGETSLRQDETNLRQDETSLRQDETT